MEILSITTPVYLLIYYLSQRLFVYLLILTIHNHIYKQIHTESGIDLVSSAAVGDGAVRSAMRYCLNRNY